MDERGAPEFAVGEEGEHGVAMGGALVLDRPPEQERLTWAGGVVVVREQVADDGQGLLGRQALGGAGKLGADFDVGFGGGEVRETL
jgi:hypothetical protein